MREELVRSDEVNQRYKQIIDQNRKQRQLLNRRLLQVDQLSIPQVMYLLRSICFTFQYS